MDLNEQAREAVSAVFAQQGMAPDDVLLSIAALCWLDGHKAGADTVRQIVRDRLAPLVSK